MNLFLHLTRGGSVTKRDGHKERTGKRERGVRARRDIFLMDLKNVIVSAFTRLRTSNLGRGCDYEDLSPDKKRQKRGKERREKEEKKKKERKKRENTEARERGERFLYPYSTEHSNYRNVVMLLQNCWNITRLLQHCYNVLCYTRKKSICVILDFKAFLANKNSEMYTNHDGIIYKNDLRENNQAESHRVIERPSMCDILLLIRERRGSMIFRAEIRAERMVRASERTTFSRKAIKRMTTTFVNLREQYETFQISRPQADWKLRKPNVRSSRFALCCLPVLGSNSVEAFEIVIAMPCIICKQQRRRHVLYRIGAGQGVFRKRVRTRARRGATNRLAGFNRGSSSRETD
ncbi:hypothetical protein ALC56_11997 [Trachymyrmex septentrionalis]|uniref:Uncharacterized protein n=1 Tax=Trachymyrmex septentrionalis TaxID=34720 RepID=A0A195F0V2_9HYME|nr:hypothetical protein ALC56_11997 [Trachymyrmex septentrionalis]